MATKRAAYLATVITAGDDVVSITPMMSHSKPTLMASEDVVVPRGLKRLLDRTAITPGQTLSPTEVQTRIKAANLSQEDGISLKLGLARLKMLDEGRPFSIWNR